MSSDIPLPTSPATSQSLDTDPDPRIPDWSRERRDYFYYQPGRELLAAIRLYTRMRSRTDPLGKAKRKWAVAQHRFWSAVCSADIPLNAQIDGGLMLPHPVGIVVHRDAIIGPNCLLFSQVTLGESNEAGAPILGGAVEVGTGAKILGPIRIGDRARIGANAVVLTDVPDGATAVGIPARIIPEK